MNYELKKARAQLGVPHPNSHGINLTLPLSLQAAGVSRGGDAVTRPGQRHLQLHPLRRGGRVPAEAARPALLSLPYGELKPIAL